MQKTRFHAKNSKTIHKSYMFVNVRSVKTERYEINSRNFHSFFFYFYFFSIIKYTIVYIIYSQNIYNGFVCINANKEMVLGLSVCRGIFLVS